MYRFKINMLTNSDAIIEILAAQIQIQDFHQVLEVNMPMERLHKYTANHYI